VPTVGLVLTYHLAQVIGRPVAPLDSPRLAGFVNQLDEVNAIADAAPGFVWRLRTEDNNATAIRVFDDDGLIINMSVWESVESLAEYVFLHLRKHGPTPYAFTFRTPFPAPGRDATRAEDDWFCPIG
jgi:hypothetical protein